MSRSLYKLPFLDRVLFAAVKAQKRKGIRKPELVYRRSTYVHPLFLDRRFLVHTGNRFIKVDVRESMVGHKFGEFSSTRRADRLRKKLKKLNRKYGTKIEPYCPAP